MSEYRAVRCAMCCVLMMATQGSVSLAQVVRDGSIGPDASVQPQGPAFEIPETMGETAGPNLFHSFSTFDVEFGASVAFQASNSIQNIFARVTEGGTSFINGRLTAPANLFLANPRGLIFGAGARLDVSGSFHAMTADYVEFDDRSRFLASRAPGRVLTVAHPRQFGFLTDRRATISLGASELNAPQIFLVGGDIAVRNSLIGSRIDPPARGIGLIAVASPGTVSLSNDNRFTPTTADFSRFGEVAISNGDLVANGPVLIRGANVVVTGFSGISSASLVDIEVDRLELRGQSTISNFGLFGDGRIGDIQVTAREAIDILGGTSALQLKPGIFAPSFGRAAVRRSVQLFTPALTIVGGFIDTSALGDGAGSDILLDVGDFRLLGGAYVRAGPSDLITNRTGPGGDIVIRAKGLVEVSGSSEVFGIPVAGSIINTSTLTSGEPGSLRIEAGRLRIFDGGTITSGPAPGTATRGSGGNIDIQARESIEIAGPDELTGIFSTTFTAADAGAVNLTAPRIVIADGGEIRANTQSSGNAGQVHITAGTLSIAEFGLIDSGTTPDSSGRGGSVRVEAQSVDLDLFGKITTSTSGTGQAGNVTVTTGELRLSESSGISSEAARSSAADAGSVIIHADRLFLDGFSALTTTSAGGAGGDMQLDVRRWIEAIDSEISTSVLGGAGGGGDIMITMGSHPDVAVMILERSRLTAQASEGRGGNMRILTDLFIPSAPPLTVVSASSEFGVAGEIQIGGPDASILATLAALPAVFMDAAGLIRESCVAQHQEAGASLLVRGRGGLPPAPGGLLPGIEAGVAPSVRSGRSEYAATVVGATGDGRPVLLAVRCGN